MRRNQLLGQGKMSPIIPWNNKISSQIPQLLNPKTLHVENQRLAIMYSLTAPSSLAGNPEIEALTSQSSVLFDLVQWVLLIAERYSLRITHFCLAFTDGSLLCRLVMLHAICQGITEAGMQV